MSKKKIYQAKTALNSDEAVRFLSELIGHDCNASDLIDVGLEHGLKAYINTDDGAFIAQDDGFEGLHTAIEVSTGQKVIPIGWHEMIGGLECCVYGYREREDLPHRIIAHLPSAPKFRGANDHAETIEWQVQGEFDDILDGKALYFKPIDIQALADKLNGKPPAEPESPRYKTKSQTQEELIFEALKDLEYKPKALPNAGGKRGAKAKTWDKVKGNDFFVSKNAFDSVWKELRRLGQIQNAKP